MSDLEVKVANVEGQLTQVTSRLVCIERVGNDNAKAIVRIDVEQSETRNILLRHSKNHKVSHDELSNSIKTLDSKMSDSLKALDSKMSEAIAALLLGVNEHRDYINKSIGRDGVVRYITGAVAGAVIAGLVGIGVLKIFGGG